MAASREGTQAPLAVSYAVVEHVAAPTVTVIVSPAPVYR
jgi:hypothetical protein